MSDASENIPVTRPGIDPGTFRLVAQRLNPGSCLLIGLFYLWFIQKNVGFSYYRHNIASNDDDYGIIIKRMLTAAVATLLFRNRPRRTKKK